MMAKMLSIVLLLSWLSLVPALDNGLALTPPMGWLSWERFRCNLDCENDPENCISEKLYKDMADLIVENGYKDAGYEFVIIDDCWMEKERDSDGRLQADAQRFPSGIKKLAEYMHSKGLKLGIYEDFGTHTCAGYPGSLNYLEIDAKTFAEWEVDYLKFDGCNVDPAEMDEGIPKMANYLNQTGRPIVFSTEWPLYQFQQGIKPDYESIAKSCNLWRYYWDIQDAWEDVQGILDQTASNQDTLVKYAGPGGWNDPDMLIVGDYGLSLDQSKVQMAMWAIMASPLIMSNDLRTIRKEFEEILLNKDIIAVNQDPLGIQGRQVYKFDNTEIWVRPITPTDGNYYSYAIAYVNRRKDGIISQMGTNLTDLGLTHPNGYHVVDLYSKHDYGRISPDSEFKVKVNSSGVVIVRAELNLGKIIRRKYFPLKWRKHHDHF